MPPDREPPDPDELTELLAEVRRIDVQSRRLVDTVLAGGYTSVFKGAGLELDHVREYVEGDDPRHVDWNVTARVGRPFVKTYHDERELTVVFALDLSASMDGGYGPWSARRIAARVCAVLALAAIRNDDKVGFVAFDEGIEEWVPPKKGAGHALRIVRDCLVRRGRGHGSDLAPPLELLSRVLRRRAVVFLISDFLATGWSPALRPCARRHEVIAVRLLAPELEPDARAGLVRVRDPETGRAALLDWSSRRVREAYAARVAAWRTRTEDELARDGVDRMDVPIPRERVKDPVARPILKFFRMRQARGAKG